MAVDDGVGGCAADDAETGGSISISGGQPLAAAKAGWPTLSDKEDDAKYEDTTEDGASSDANGTDAEAASVRARFAAGAAPSAGLHALPSSSSSSPLVLAAMALARRRMPLCHVGMRGAAALAAYSAPAVSSSTWATARCTAGKDVKTTEDSCAAVKAAL